MATTANFNTIIEAPLASNQLTVATLTEIETYVPVNNKFYPANLQTSVPIVLGYGFTDIFCNNSDSPKIDYFCRISQEQLEWINNQLSDAKLEKTSKKYVEETHQQTPKTYNLNDIITTNIENPSYRFPEQPKEIVGYINPYDFLNFGEGILNVYPGAYDSFEIIVYSEKSGQEVTIKTNLQGSSVVNSFIPNVLNSWFPSNGYSIRLYFIMEELCRYPGYQVGEKVECGGCESRVEGTIVKIGFDGQGDYMDLNSVTGTWGVDMTISGRYCRSARVQNVINRGMINKNTGIGRFLDNPKFEKNI